MIGVASISSAGPRGTVPKSSVEQYRAHAVRDGVGIGAVQLPPDQVHKMFAADVNRCCLVVEVAFYPAKDKPLARPYSARAVASTLQERAEQGRAVTTTTSAGVGYESGTYIDPVTGQPTKVHGVTTETGVGVAVAPPGSRPGATNRDRDSLEIELAETGLPEGSASTPVAGYLYFPRTLKRKKNTPLQLQYALKDQTVVLSLP
jgi:hypothetical protein